MNSSVRLHLAYRRLKAREEIREPLLDGLPFVFNGFKLLGVNPVVSDNCVRRKFGVKACVADRDLRHCIEPLGRPRIIVGSVDVDHGRQRGLKRLNFVPVPLAHLEGDTQRLFQHFYARLKAVAAAHRIPFRWYRNGHPSTGLSS